jgi:hypothetical protein
LKICLVLEIWLDRNLLGFGKKLNLSETFATLWKHVFLNFEKVESFEAMQTTRN